MDLRFSKIESLIRYKFEDINQSMVNSQRLSFVTTMVVEDKSHLTLREKYTEEENKKGETPLSNNQKSTMSKKKNNIYPHY